MKQRTIDAGAFPLMFLEPVAWVHRTYRTMRHRDGSLAKR
jgi:hypothetical protein